MEPQRKSGYRVMTVRLRGNRVLSCASLVTGFEQDERAWGRPVDVQALPDGGVLIAMIWPVRCIG